MFRSRLLVAILLLSAFLFSCSGEDGATGPAGKNGADGNANVLSYTYGSRTTTSGTITYAFPASQGLVDSCLVLAYFQMTGYSNLWYPIPGVGPDALFQTRSYCQPANATTQNLYVKLVTMAGATYTTSTTFSAMKIFLVPPSLIVPATSRGQLNLSDYNAVREYLNLSE
jgi:hypothetical protein